MLSGPSPVGAATLLEDLGLLPIVLDLATLGGDAGAAVEGQLSPGSGQRVALALGSWAALEPELGALSPDEKRLVSLAAVLFPARDEVAPAGPKGRLQPLATASAREALKWKAKDAEGLDVLLQASKAGAEIVRDLCQELESWTEQQLEASENAQSKQDQNGPSEQLGAPTSGGTEEAPLEKDGKRIDEPSSESRASSLDALPAAFSPSPSLRIALGTLLCASKTLFRPSLALLVLEPADPPEASRARKLLALLARTRLDDCWTWKPLLNGKDIAQLTGAKGAAIGKAMAGIAQQRLANPDWTADDAKAWLANAQKENA